MENLLTDKITSDIGEEDVKGLEFSSVEATKVFYRKYALYVGFGVRRDAKWCDGNGIVTKRR